MQRWNRDGSMADDNRRFIISYMTWDAFFAFLQRPRENEQCWRILTSVDCVMGGFDLDSPYLWGTFFFVASKMSLIFFGWRENNYGLTRGNFEEILKNLDRLRRYVHVWPPQDQPNTIGSKIQSIQNLDHIAARRTFSTRPITRELITHELIPDDIVIKRTHSDSGIHVLLPGDKNRNWEYMQAHSEIPRCRWFGQTYMEMLHRLGEWRTFVVGGKIIYTVHTYRNSHRDTWKWDMVREYYSLRELRYGEFSLV